jgi:uncharacterized spore protein YtfJ
MNELQNQFTKLQKDHDELKKQFEELKSMYYKNNFIAEQIFTKNVTFKGGVNFSNTSLGFFSTSPIAQKNHISDPSGGGTAGVDSPARNAINSILSVLESYGLTKTS